MSKRILVIDDERVIRKSFELALEDTGFDVETADGGEQGLAMLQSGKYDLIFLDLKMPGLNGVETLRRIRLQGAKMPVYIITAFHTEFLKELKTLKNEGVDFELLRKPIGADQIAEIVRGNF